MEPPFESASPRFAGGRGVLVDAEEDVAVELSSAAFSTSDRLLSLRVAVLGSPSSLAGFFGSAAVTLTVFATPPVLRGEARCVGLKRVSPGGALVERRRDDAADVAELGVLKAVPRPSLPLPLSAAAAVAGCVAAATSDTASSPPPAGTSCRRRAWASFGLADVFAEDVSEADIGVLAFATGTTPAPPCSTARGVPPAPRDGEEATGTGMGVVDGVAPGVAVLDEASAFRFCFRTPPRTAAPILPPPLVLGVVPVAGGTATAGLSAASLVLRLPRPLDGIGACVLPAIESCSHPFSEGGGGACDGSGRGERVG